MQAYHSVEVWFLVWTASRLELCPLDLGADHTFAQEGLTTQEEFVVVSSTVISSCQSIEAI